MRQDGAGALAAALLGLALGACEPAARNMYDQPRYQALAASTLWADGRAARPLPPGVVAHGAGVLAADASGRRGALPQADAALPPQAVTPALLARGRERYDIYCAPCHSVVGDGDGMAVRRGFPRPAPLYGPAAQRLSDRHLYDVIGEGYGLMFPFGDRIAVPDRWAIVAYVRALQLSRSAPLAALSPADRAALELEVRR